MQFMQRINSKKHNTISSNYLYDKADSYFGLFS